MALGTNRRRPSNMTSTRLILALALGLGLGIAAPARAVTFSSPILQTEGSMSCFVTNVGKKPIDVVVTIHNFSGAVLPTSGSCNDGPLDVGATCLENVSFAQARCTVDASSSKVRAVFAIIEGTKTTAVVPLTK
jgi:hypothetical protein